LKIILNWLVKEGVALDKDKAKLVIKSEIGILSQEDEGLLIYDEFNRIFCRGVFKQALITISQKFEGEMKRKGPEFEDLPLDRKIESYSRSHMIQNIKPGA
jgi:hypothetical protein